MNIIDLTQNTVNSVVNLRVYPQNKDNDMALAAKSIPKHQDFTLPAFNLPVVDPQSLEPSPLSEESLLGQYSVLFLYPKDDTSGCTQESLEFTDLKADFDSQKIALYGLSKDSVKKHAAFIKKYNLTMPLISDEQTFLIAALGSWQEKSLYGRKYMGTDRSTFVINPQGVVIMSWRKVKAKGHALQVWDFVKSLIG